MYTIILILGKCPMLLHKISCPDRIAVHRQCVSEPWAKFGLLRWLKSFRNLLFILDGFLFHQSTSLNEVKCLDRIAGFLRINNDPVEAFHYCLQFRFVSEVNVHLLVSHFIVKMPCIGLSICSPGMHYCLLYFRVFNVEFYYSVLRYRSFP